MCSRDLWVTESRFNIVTPRERLQLLCVTRYFRSGGLGSLAACLFDLFDCAFRVFMRLDINGLRKITTSKDLDRHSLAINKPCLPERIRGNGLGKPPIRDARFKSIDIYDLILNAMRGIESEFRKPTRQRHLTAFE